MVTDVHLDAYFEITDTIRWPEISRYNCIPMNCRRSAHFLLPLLGYKLYVVTYLVVESW
jgi:hypothetical protein